MNCDLSQFLSIKPKIRISTKKIPWVKNPHQMKLYLPALNLPSFISINPHLFLQIPLHHSNPSYLFKREASSVMLKVLVFRMEVEDGGKGEGRVWGLLLRNR